MAENSSGRGLTVLAAGIGGLYAIRLVQQLRRRATNPDMKDPGKQFRRCLQWLPPGMLLVIVVAGVAIGRRDVVGVILAIGLVVVGIIITAAISIWLWVAAESRRRAAGYIICEAQYLGAPRQIKSSMRRIYRSAASVRSGRAYQDGMFGDLELDRMVFGAARRALLSSELAAAVRDLNPDAKSEDRKATDHANAQINEIRGHLAEVEKALKRGANTANRLSERLAEPERERAAQQAAERQTAASKDRRDRARGRLDEVTAKAAGQYRYDATSVEDRIAAVSAGYEEVVELSAGLLGDLVRAGEYDSEKATARDTVLKLARFSAVKVTKLSAAAARSGAERLKNRNQDKHPN